MSTDTPLSPEDLAREERLRWFRDARFGMFIHWGLYAQLGRGEWVMNRERIPIAEYEPLADTWSPKPNAAREWAKLAKQAGMRYMVLTTKHHEGFCLWDSQLNDYCATKHGPGRDLVAEYVDAARAEGLRVGFYYSLMDWRHPDGAACAYDEAARRRFVDYTHGLVRELCTNYGEIDLMWYDVHWPLDAAGWESARLNAMVRELQPNILINNRSGLPEDFGTPEGQITPEKGGRAWEACMTFDDSWGYVPYETNAMSSLAVLHMLRQVANGGGNLLLNIGPKPDGSVKESHAASLRTIGDWMQQHGPVIYDATDPMQQEWLFTGNFTRNGNTAYYLCHRWPGAELAIGGLQTKVLNARFHNGPQIRFTQTADRLLLHNLPSQAPNSLATVIELTFDGEPKQVLRCGHVLIDNDPWK
ncbi:MAG: alpha-L-fucosidase [Armatimonadota bacterium]